MASEILFGLAQNHWEITTLGDVCVRGGGNIQTGPFGSQLHASDYVAEGIPSIMPQNLSEDRISTEGIAHIRQEDALRLERYSVQAGDIVYSRRGDVERRALVTEAENGWLCGTGCLRVRFGNGVVDPRYAYYYLGHPSVRDWVVRHAIGATLPNLNTSILAALPFALPPIEEQEAIASILGSLDDKIEQNRHENETLKAMARALFRSWFVDFDPVRAKMEGRQPVGMDADTAALFPDGFEESALGPIPRGWQVKELGACSDYLSRGVAPSYVGESPVRTLNQKAIQWWNLDQSAFKFHDPNKAVRSDAFIRKDDLVINSTGDGTIGRIYWFYHDLEDLFADSHVAIVRLAKDVLLPEMVVF